MSETRLIRVPDMGDHSCLIGSLKLYVSFAKEPYKRDYILQKSPMILRSLLIIATPYETWRIIHIWSQYSGMVHTYMYHIIVLLCRIWSLLGGSFVKETYSLKERTNRSHPIRPPYETWRMTHMWSHCWDMANTHTHHIWDMSNSLVRLDSCISETWLISSRVIASSICCGG